MIKNKIIKRNFVKKITTLSLAFCMIFSTPLITNAQSIDEDSITKAEIEKIVNEYGYVIVEDCDTQNVAKMDSLEELESYLQSIDEVASTPIEETVKVSKPTQTILNNTLTLYANRGSNISDHHLFNWYNPFAGFDGVTLLCWSNVYMGYTYKFVNSKPQFVSVDSVKSYLSGIRLTTWEQNGFDKTFKKTNSTKDTVVLTVDGCYVLGFEVKGLCIGAKRNGTWTCTLNLE